MRVQNRSTLQIRNVPATTRSPAFRVSRIVAAGWVLSLLASCAAPPPSDADLTAALADTAAKPDERSPARSHMASAADDRLLAQARALAYGASENKTPGSETNPAIPAPRAAHEQTIPRSEATGPLSSATQGAMTPEDVMARLRSLAAASRSSRSPNLEHEVEQPLEANARITTPEPQSFHASAMSPDEMMRRMRELSAAGKVAARLSDTPASTGSKVSEDDLKAFGGLPKSIHAIVASSPLSDSTPTSRVD